MRWNKALACGGAAVCPENSAWRAFKWRRITSSGFICVPPGDEWREVLLLLHRRRNTIYAKLRFRMRQWKWHQCLASLKNPAFCGRVRSWSRMDWSVQWNNSSFRVPLLSCHVWPAFIFPLSWHCRSNRVESKYCDAVSMCSFNMERGGGWEGVDRVLRFYIIRELCDWASARRTALPTRKKTNLNRSVVPLRFKGTNAAITPFAVTPSIWRCAFFLNARRGARTRGFGNTDLHTARVQAGS